MARCWERGQPRKDPVWNDVVVADDVVSCKKCERIIHLLGETHVERVRDHFKRKGSKRPFALWFYSTGMTFNKVNHATLVKAMAILNPGAVLPTPRELATTLLCGSCGELKLVMVHRVAGKKCDKSVVDYMLICEDETYFLGSVEGVAGLGCAPGRIPELLADLFFWLHDTLRVVLAF
ncbi:hypothetical protein PHYSODRAFT_331461 [Phytophthora sojae]|uniref:BED-type domain-containing protein n=1 Tax=Phytophthora sojae (strain P6497) TaxID=1094619 RepID=G4ZFH6_PHYSP|nr:hypothetical protein PHYSODRAFT_331458 [Phytophthora sojae]XP_009526550.1 hypothetical protein PHYSODRAFT_331461 [Phytophthora sojae]EGZ17490.1 hypothetical protein PHYSODRAFT_331458 [Phytophthora sojae]EGZ17492.1 hypothetical protein PHYSODRAFT_331461 [Phytophthora sojae]|eukprot:XP_009526548.1 hypothetical protein PHYSODRAFT_331458 [Phytophthora sojae]